MEVEKIKKTEEEKKFFTKSRIYLLISISLVMLMPLYYELMIRLYL